MVNTVIHITVTALSILYLTLSPLGKNSAGNILKYFSYFSKKTEFDTSKFQLFPENRIKHFMQIVTIGDNLHEMFNPVFWEK